MVTCTEKRQVSILNARRIKRVLIEKCDATTYVSGDSEKAQMDRRKKSATIPQIYLIKQAPFTVIFISMQHLHAQPQDCTKLCPTYTGSGKALNLLNRARYPQHINPDLGSPSIDTELTLGVRKLRLSTPGTWGSTTTATSSLVLASLLASCCSCSFIHVSPSTLGAVYPRSDCSSPIPSSITSEASPLLSIFSARSSPLRLRVCSILRLAVFKTLATLSSPVCSGDGASAACMLFSWTPLVTAVAVAELPTRLLFSFVHTSMPQSMNTSQDHEYSMLHV